MFFQNLINFIRHFRTSSPPSRPSPRPSPWPSPASLAPPPSGGGTRPGPARGGRPRAARGEAWEFQIFTLAIPIQLIEKNASMLGLPPWRERSRRRRGLRRCCLFLRKKREEEGILCCLLNGRFQKIFTGPPNSQSPLFAPSLVFCIPVLPSLLVGQGELKVVITLIRFFT